jgi:hypothetical protein
MILVTIVTFLGTERLTEKYPGLILEFAVHHCCVAELPCSNIKRNK